jgi:hypothetical protein
MSFLSENLQDCVKVVTVVTASCNTCTNLNESRTYEEAIEKCIEAEDRAHTVGAPNFTSMYRLSVFRQYEEDICNRFFGGPILRIQEVYPMVSAYVSYYTSTKTIYAKGVRRTEITTDEAISSSLVPRDHHPASITSLNISTLPAIPCGTNGPIFTRTSLDLYESAM